MASRGRSTALAVLACCSALVTTTGALRADWLAMLDGSRLETAGPWEVRGAQVVFKLANGTLATLPARDVDLELSRRLTTEAKEPPAAAAATPAPTREPVVRLTDADVGHVDDVPAAPAPTGTADASPAAAAQPTGDAKPASGAGAAQKKGLEVVAWDSQADYQGQTTTLTGTVRNNGTVLAFDIKVVASLYDAGGGLLVRVDGRLSSPGLAPGETGTFTISFPGAVRVDRVDFELSGRRPTDAPQATPKS